LAATCDLQNLDPHTRKTLQASVSDRISLYCGRFFIGPRDNYCLNDDNNKDACLAEALAV